MINRKRYSKGAKVFLAIYVVTFIVIVVSLMEFLTCGLSM